MGNFTVYKSVSVWAYFHEILMLLQGSDKNTVEKIALFGISYVYEARDAAEIS